MANIKVVNFYVGDVSKFREIADEIARLTDGGYKPLMQLSISESYSVWVFAKEESK